MDKEHKQRQREGTTDNILNANEFAHAIRVSLPTAYSILRSGKVKAVKVGRRQWRVTRAAVDAYLYGEVVDGGTSKVEEAQQAA